MTQGKTHFYYQTQTPEIYADARFRHKNPDHTQISGEQFQIISIASDIIENGIRRDGVGIQHHAPDRTRLNNDIHAFMGILQHFSSREQMMNLAYGARKLSNTLTRDKQLVFSGRKGN